MIQLDKDEFNSLNKSNACSVESITSSCSVLGGLTYMRETMMAAVGEAGLTLKTLTSQLL